MRVPGPRSHGPGRPAQVDLLVEQIECADILVLNKMDQVDAEQLSSCVTTIDQA